MNHLSPTISPSTLLSPVLFAILASLMGCSVQDSNPVPLLTPGLSKTISGRAYAGQQPVVNSEVQLYTVGTTGDGSKATALLNRAITTAEDGSFDITGAYDCGNATLVYITVTAGNPGTIGPNPNLALMTSLGNCSTLTSSTYIMINEVTTVAAVAALAPYMLSSREIGSGNSEVSNLAAAFLLSTELADPATGASPGRNAPPALSVPTRTINTLANIVAACINSKGGVAGDSGGCGLFFSLTTPPGGLAPTDTISALLNLANHPTINTLALYNTALGVSPFEPALTAAPVDFLLRFAATPGQLIPGATVQLPFTERAGAVAYDVSGNHNDCVFGTGTSAPLWVKGGIDHVTGGYSYGYCSLPPSVTLSDVASANSRTITWCGYIRPQANGMLLPGYSVLIGSSNIIGAGTLWLSGSNIGRSTGYLADWTQASGHIGGVTSQPIIGWHCVTSTRGSTGDSTNNHLYIDDAETSYTYQTPTWDLRRAGDFDQVGQAGWGVGFAFSINLTSYVIEYPVVLTPAQVSQNFQSLQYLVFQSRGLGLPPTLNSSPVPNLICNGDSLMNGTPGGVTPPCSGPEFQALLDQTYDISNIAQAGTTIKSHAAEVPQKEALLYRPSSRVNLVFENAGINDLNVGSGSAAQVYADSVLWAAASRIAGFQPVWLTMISSVAQDTTVQAVNAMKRANAAAQGVLLADVAEDTCLGKTGAYTNPPPCADLQSDGLHESQAGADAMRAIMANAANWFTGSTINRPTYVTASSHAIQAGERYISDTPSGGTSALTLPSCIGYSATTPFIVQNDSSGGSVTVAAIGAELLDGVAKPVSVLTGAHLLFISSALPSDTGGCSWKSQ